jgi:hypothetical protein
MATKNMNAVHFAFSKYFNLCNSLKGMEIIQEAIKIEPRLMTALDYPLASFSGFLKRFRELMNQPFIIAGDLNALDTVLLDYYNSSKTDMSSTIIAFTRLRRSVFHYLQAKYATDDEKMGKAAKVLELLENWHSEEEMFLVARYIQLFYSLLNENPKAGETESAEEYKPALETGS